MDDTIANQSFLWFFGSVFLGPLIGWLAHFRGGFERGVAVACLIIGVTGAVCGVRIGLDRAEQLRGTVAVEGRLINFETRRTKDADGEVSVTYEPRVLYVAADGLERHVTGLGGSQQSKDEGDPVPVRYWQDNPDRAVIADFQNQWGGVLAFGVFGGFPLMFGLFFLGLSRKSVAHLGPAARPERWRPTAANLARKVWAQRFIVAGNVLLFVSILGMGVSPYEVAPTLAAGFCAVAATMGVYMVGFALGPNRSWEAFGVLFILMAGFGVFGVGLFLLGMEG